MGTAHSNYRHDDPVGGEVSGMDKCNPLFWAEISQRNVVHVDSVCAVQLRLVAASYGTVTWGKGS